MEEQRTEPVSSSSSSIGAPGGAAKKEEGLVVSSPRAGGPPSFFGRHRLTASITHLENQIKILQEELDELETIGGSSLVCEELISSVASSPDPLLPITKGPTDVSWDRWFTGSHGSKGHRRWI